MQVNLKPETQKFIQDQLDAGQFTTPEELLEEAVARMIDESDISLDVETVAAIQRAEQQIAEGQWIDFDTFAAQMRAKMSTR